MNKYGKFPEWFLWGAATSAYQVEGAANEEGRKPSIWDTFSRLPGRIENDHTGDVAVDQYHRYAEDVKLIQWIGLKAYRFSVSWPRVLPDGTGSVNEKGMDYYNRLIDALLEAGIAPWVTFFHWDLPQTLEDRFGGWTSTDTARAFGDYVGEMVDRISDRVRNYITINEFGCFTDFGYRSGQFAPGRCLSPQAANQVRHNALLAHGYAVQAIRDRARITPNIGLAENSTVCLPVIETEAHIEAARRAMRHLNAHFLTTVLEGAYPESYLEEEGPDAPRFNSDEMALIGAPLDFVGMNMYTPSHVRAAQNEKGYELVAHPRSYPRMNMPWLRIGPRIAYWGPRHLKEIWGVDSVYITENGCACDDKLTHDGEVLDTDRAMYLRQHLVAAQRAVEEGWPLKGYFIWSLLDNFEWNCGYNKRFGIVYVNHQTQERTPKLSAHLIREMITRGHIL